MIRVQFRLDLGQVTKELDQVVIRVQQKVALQLLTGIVMMNPVLSGRSRGNWYVTLGQPSEAYEAESFAGGAEDVVERGQEVLAGISTLGAVYITNNTPYIMRLEQGSSKQAPQGMVQVTLDRVRAQFERG